MPLASAAETDLLRLLFENITWGGVGDVTGIVGSTVAGSLYVSLHTASVGASGNQSTSEAAYTNYARVAVARSSSGWTVLGAAPAQAVNAGAVTFPTCGATGATATDFAVGKSLSGTGEVLWYGSLASPLVIGSGVTPSFAIGQLSCTIL